MRKDIHCIYIIYKTRLYVHKIRVLIRLLQWLSIDENKFQEVLEMKVTIVPEDNTWDSGEVTKYCQLYTIYTIIQTRWY